MQIGKNVFTRLVKAREKKLQSHTLPQWRRVKFESLMTLTTERI